MKLFDKKNIVKIGEDDIKDARLSSIDFADDHTKKRAFVDVLGARLAMKLLFSQKIQANNIYSLYTIHNVLEELDLADIYYQGIKIDVRLVFDKNEIFIPRKHFEYDLLPDLYIVLCLNEGHSTAELLGFFEPKNLDKSNANSDFYFCEYDRLTKPEKLIGFLDNFVAESNFEISEEASKKSTELFLTLVDKEISQKDKRSLFKELSKSFELREKAIEFENFEIISRAVAKNETMLDDSTLEYVSGGADEILPELEVKSNGEEETDDTPSAFDDKSVEEDPFEIIEAEDFSDFEAETSLDDIYPEAEEDPEDKPTPGTSDKSMDGAIIAGGAIVAAAGLGLAGEIIKASAGVAATGAEVQSAVIAGAADAAVAGIGLGSELLNSELPDFEHLAQTDETQLPEIKTQEDDLTQPTLAEDDLPSFQDLVQQDVEENGLSDYEFLVQQTLDETELPDFEQLVQTDETQLPEIETQENDLEINALPKIEDEEFFSEIDQDTPVFTSIAEDFSINEDLPELDIQEASGLEELQDFNDLEKEENDIKINEDVENSKEEVFSLDNFDFNLLEENSGEPETTEEVVSVEPENNIIPTDSTEATKAPENLEEKEGFATNADLDSDEFISQVDAFLGDVDLSEEQRLLLQQTLMDGEAEDMKSLNDTTPSVPEATASEDKTIEFIENEDDKDLLKILFEKEKINNLPDLDIGDETEPPKNISASKNKKMVIAASIAGVVLVSFVIGGSLNKNNNPNLPNKMTTAQATANGQANSALPTKDTTMDPSQNQNAMDGQMNGQAVQSLPGEEQQAQPNLDMGKAVSDAFSSEPVSASISKVAWEVPEDLAYNDSFRKYLQIAGKNLKLNLQNDLLLATEMAYSNKVIVDLNIAKDGSLQSENIIASSGSKQIDKIVLQSVKDTMKYLKVPSSELSSGSANATLIINF